MVQYKGQARKLAGKADCTLGYRNQQTNAGNLVVVEAKQRYHVGQPYEQLLSYMGKLRLLCFIYEFRKREQKEHQIVYGVATDGWEYRSWRIGSNSG